MKEYSPERLKDFGEETRITGGESLRSNKQFKIGSTLATQKLLIVFNCGCVLKQAGTQAWSPRAQRCGMELEMRYRWPGFYAPHGVSDGNQTWVLF